MIKRKFKQIQTNVLTARAVELVEEIHPHITGKKVLDLGTGTGINAVELSKKGYDISPVDVVDLSFDDIDPIIYDGKTLPFEDDTFDTTMILFVLHHTEDPVQILREVMRVTQSRIIIKEDIYRNRLEKFSTQIADSLVNFEFFGHPHTNLNDEEWKKTYQKLGLPLIHDSYKRVNFCLLPFYHALYVLDISDTNET